MQNKENKKDYIFILFISVALDLLIFLGETPFIISLFGSSLIVDELLELVLSKLLSRNKIELKWYDYLIGLLPLPGVTAISVYALRKLLK